METELSEKARALRDKYLVLSHSMQAGVAVMMGVDPQETAPKHLRVGINSAMVSDAALVGLLIAKGLLTYEEYYQSLVDAMEREVQSYKDNLQRLYPGTNIELF